MYEWMKYKSRFLCLYCEYIFIKCVVQVSVFIYVTIVREGLCRTTNLKVFSLFCLNNVMCTGGLTVVSVVWQVIQLHLPL